jgi:uncharacterized protein
MQSPAFNQKIAIFTIRVLLGLILFMQGYAKVFKFTINGMYENMFMPYEAILPEFLVLFAAYFTTYVELIGGLLLIIGLFRNWVLYAVGLVLLIVAFGHGLQEGIWDLSHVMYRGMLVFVLLLLPEEWDVWQISKFKIKISKLRMTILKNIRFLGIVLLLFSSITSFAQSYTIETIPDPKSGFAGGFISDPQSYLSTDDVYKINVIIGSIEKVSGAQVAVVMLPSIGEENPKEFSTALFNKWRIGQKNSDNGLLILTVMDQRRTEFETGFGTEAVLPDAICYRVGMQELVPHYKLGNYGSGIAATLVKIQEILENPETVAEFQHNERIYDDSSSSFSPLYVYIIVNLMFHLGLIIWILLTMMNKEDLYDKYKSIRPIHGWWFAIPFPIPYILAYFLIGNLLKKLRNHERFSKKNGNPMRKLSEAEEDDFLEQGQVIEEEIGSVDYDVWVDEDGDDLLILRYADRFSKYKLCVKCNFKTYFHAHTLVVESATYSSSGTAEIIHECKNCGYKKNVERTIPRKQRSSGGGGFSAGGGGGGGSWGGGSSGGGGAGVSW